MPAVQPAASKKSPENLEVMIFDTSGNLREDVDLEELGRHLSDEDALIWGDICAKDEKGGPYWRLLVETFGFEQLTVEDCFT